MWEIHTSGVRTGWGSPPPYSIDFTLFLILIFQKIGLQFCSRLSIIFAWIALAFSRISSVFTVRTRPP